MLTPSSSHSSQDDADSHHSQHHQSRQDRRDHALQMQQLVDEYRESFQARAQREAQQYDAAGGLIYLDCVDVASGRCVYIRAVRSRRFRRMREALEERFGHPPGSVTLRHRGRTLEDHETPAEVDMPQALTEASAVPVEVVRSSA